MISRQDYDDMKMTFDKIGIIRHKNDIKMAIMKLKLSRHQHDITITCNNVILKCCFIDIAQT